jgi:DNA-directed RNA polymerase beta' subunit
MSVCRVIHPFGYVKGIPKIGGLFDLKMGARSNIQCTTCHGYDDTCPGHFGHIELCEPMYNQGFMSIVYKILRCVCFTCSALLVNHTDTDTQDITGSMISTVPKKKILFFCIINYTYTHIQDKKLDIIKRIATGKAKLSAMYNLCSSITTCPVFFLLNLYFFSFLLDFFNTQKFRNAEENNRK